MPRHYLFLLQRRCFMQAVASVLLCTFTWLLVHPTLLAAQTLGQNQVPVLPGPVNEDIEFSEAIAKIEGKLAKLHDKLTRAENTHVEDEEITQWRRRIEHLDTRARKTFDRMAQHLREKGVPAEILQRHQAMVTAYAAELTTLRRNLDELATASTAETRKDKAVQTLQHLQEKQQRRNKPRFDPNHLPFRVPDGTVRKPKETKEEFQSALFESQSIMVAAATPLPDLLTGAQEIALPVTPSPDDLMPTEDVQFTTGIETLAATLDNNPVQIYNWVHDNIAFLPTYGAIQDSQMTLQTKQGNAFDTASLLIALLRTAKIPARYAVGTVQIPIDKVMNWVGGVAHPEAALQVLGQGGIPSTALVQGGVITAVKLEHVWVEAWVDFIPSRGAIHREGDTWVPMDVAFKQYHHIPGLDLQGQVPFDAQGIVTQLTASAQSNETEGWVSRLDHALMQRTLTTYQDQVNAYVAAQKTNATAGDVLGTKTIIPAHRPVLAMGLPYQLVVRGPMFAQLPETLRHQFRFTLYATALDRLSDVPIFHLTQSLPALAGKKITLSFTPASQADATLLGSYLPTPPADGRPLDPNTLPTSLPGYLIHVIAELRIDGIVVAHGGPFTMGQILVATAGLYDPMRGWYEVETTPPVAGEYRALAIDGAGIAAHQVQALSAKLTTTKTRLETRQLTDLTAEDLAGDLLYSTVVSYFAAVDVTGQLSAGAAGMVEYRRPSFGSFTAKVQPQLLFGIPRTVSFPGLELDIMRLDSLIVSKTNDRAAQVAYVRQSGLRQSAYEHQMPTRLFTDAAHPGEAVSAVQALAVASRQGLRIYTVTPDTLAFVLPQLRLSTDVITEIQDAVAAGKHVIISQHEITVGSWSGVGYIILDPATGAGAYQINGGANGGFFLGALAGTFLIYALIAIWATVTVSGPLLVAAAGLLIGELAVFITAFVLLYQLVSPEDRPCFWAGVAGVVLLATIPAVQVASSLAWLLFGVDVLIYGTIDSSFPSNCLSGLRSLA